jgi:hypothetical protein
MFRGGGMNDDTRVFWLLVNDRFGVQKQIWMINISRNAHVSAGCAVTLNRAAGNERKYKFLYFNFM